MIKVPFGMYKGKLIDYAAADHQYVWWLTTRPWFMEPLTPFGRKLLQLSGFAGHGTPHYEGLRHSFTDETHCETVAQIIWDQPHCVVDAFVFEQNGWAVIYDATYRGTTISIHVACIPVLADDFSRVLHRVINQQIHTPTSTLCVVVGEVELTQVHWSDVCDHFAKYGVTLLTHRSIVNRTVANNLESRFDDC